MKSGAHFVLLLGGRKRTEVLLLTGRRFCDCVSDFSGGFSFKFMPRGGGTCNNSKKAAIRTRSGEWTIFKMAASSPSLKGGYVTWNDIRAIILAHYVYVDCMSLQRGHFGRWTDLPGRDTMLLYNYRVPYFRCLFLSKSGTVFFRCVLYLEISVISGASVFAACWNSAFIGAWSELYYIFRWLPLSTISKSVLIELSSAWDWNLRKF